MDLASFNESGTSDLLSRFTYDMENLAGGIQTLFGRAVREPLKMVACLILARPSSAGSCCCCRWWWRRWPACLIGLLAKTLKRANRKALEEMSSLYAILVETFSGIKVVKAFTMERHERRRFHRDQQEVLPKGDADRRRSTALINPVTEVMGISTICLAIAGRRVPGDEPAKRTCWASRCASRPLSLSALLVFYGMLAGVSDPARRLTEVFNKLQRAAAASDRVYQLLDREPTVCDPPPARVRCRGTTATWSSTSVSFRYTAGQPVLEDIDLRIPFGETVAIVGPNGCGKSTLANLIPRFFDPVSGSVRLDGVDLRDVRLRDLRGQIGLVTQETLLFDDTVLNNIRYGCPQATREQVIEAAKQAHAHKFIEQKLEARLRDHRRARAAAGSRAASGSGSPWPGPFCATRRF